MRVFHCSQCQAMIFFENTLCVNCGHALGFVPEGLRLEALKPVENGLWQSPLGLHRRCVNDLCNWLIPAHDSRSCCQACRLNRTLPDLTSPLNRQRLTLLESAKRRWLYGILQLGLACPDRGEDPLGGLAFDFLSPELGPVLTGHGQGIISINAAEADDATREWARVNLNESYRTLLGHFRHESGHYYWDRLVAGTGWHQPFRELFGDENPDYGAALQRHHQEGPPTDWREQGYISAYASCHPWEDWAETWAHYLHVADTLDTARAFGLSPPRGPDWGDFGELIQDWVPLTLAINCLNRSMGLQDLYPFVLSGPAVRKLSFVHEVVRGAQTFLSW